MNLSGSRLHAIVGSSFRMRDELFATFRADWEGGCQAEADGDRLPDLVMDLGTPSLFGGRRLVSLRADERLLKRYADDLLPLVGVEVVAGVLVLLVDKLPLTGELGKALKRAGAYHVITVPTRKDIQPWLVERLQGLPGGVERPGEVAKALLQHYGEDPDALLGGLDVACCHAGDGVLTTADVLAVSGSTAGRPVWEFTGAVLGGDVHAAFRLLAADRQLTPDGALAAIAAEIAKRLACQESRDDGEVWDMLGGRRGGSLYYVRRDAAHQDRDTLTALLRGAVRGLTDCRSGQAPELVLEQYLIRAHRVIRPPRRPESRGFDRCPDR
jgi:hypothetical protein